MLYESTVCVCVCLSRARPWEALSTPAAGAQTPHKWDLMYCRLHDTHEAGPPAWLPSAQESSDSEETAQSFLSRVTRGPPVQTDAPRMFPFSPLRQGTGPTLDPALRLLCVLTLCHSVFWLPTAAGDTEEAFLFKQNLTFLRRERQGEHLWTGSSLGLDSVL